MTLKHLLSSHHSGQCILSLRRHHRSQTPSKHGVWFKQRHLFATRVSDQRPASGPRSHRSDRAAFGASSALQSNRRPWPKRSGLEGFHVIVRRTTPTVIFNEIFVNHAEMTSLLPPHPRVSSWLPSFESSVDTRMLGRAFLILQPCNCWRPLQQHQDGPEPEGPRSTPDLSVNDAHVACSIRRAEGPEGPFGSFGPARAAKEQSWMEVASIMLHESENVQM